MWLMQTFELLIWHSQMKYQCQIEFCNLAFEKSIENWNFQFCIRILKRNANFGFAVLITVWVDSNIREISWQGILIPNTHHLFEVTKNDFENRKYSKMLWLISYPKVATLLMFWTVFLKISEYKDQKRIRYIAIALVSSLYTVIEYIWTILCLR